MTFTLQGNRSFAQHYSTVEFHKFRKSRIAIVQLRLLVGNYGVAVHDMLDNAVAMNFNLSRYPLITNTDFDDELVQ